MTTPTAELSEAEQALRNLVNHAYEHGYHEMGYDPVRAALDAAKAAGRAEGLKEAAQLVRDSKCGGIEEDLADRIAALTATHGTVFPLDTP